MEEEGKEEEEEEEKLEEKEEEAVRWGEGNKRLHRRRPFASKPSRRRQAGSRQRPTTASFPPAFATSLVVRTGVRRRICKNQYTRNKRKVYAEEKRKKRKKNKTKKEKINKNK